MTVLVCPAVGVWVAVGVCVPVGEDVAVCVGVAEAVDMLVGVAVAVDIESLIVITNWGAKPAVPSLDE